MEVKTPWLKNKATGIVSIRSDKDDTFTTSGNPAVIDNMSNLVKVDDLQIAIEPVQDLHGYDHPWVGGAGKNLCADLSDYTITHNGITFTFSEGHRITIQGTSNASNADSTTRSFGGTNPKPITFKAGITYTASISGITETPRIRLFLRQGTSTNAWYGDSTTGVWTFSLAEDTVVDYFMIRVPTSGSVVDVDGYFQIEEGNAPTEWTPYENICPISGWTKVTATSSLKNLLQNTSSSKSSDGITFTKQSDGTVVANGTATADVSFIINFTWHLDDGDYQLSGCAEGGTLSTYYCFLWDRTANTRAKDWNGNTSDSSLNPTQIVKVRMEKGVQYAFYCRVRKGTTVSNITFYPMICAKYHGTVYIKYTANTAVIDLGGTRYGGTLDMYTGVLTDEYLYRDNSVVTGWDWSIQTTSGEYTMFTIRRTSWSDEAGEHTIYCNGLEYIPYISAFYQNANAHIYADKAITITNTYRIYVWSTQSTVEDFKQWLTDNGIEICIKAKTPTTVQLTPSILRLASGVTYNFADTGRIVSIRTISPATLTNPTRFDSKPLIRVWGNGTLNVNSYYITVADSPYDYIDIDCELMDCYHGSSNANQYVTFSTTGFVTLKSGANYFSYSGFSGVRVIPRWYEI